VTRDPRDAVLLDIDGTLIDSTYHHALAWQRAFDTVGRSVPFWRIHRTVGMGGDKLVAAVAGDEVEKRHGDHLREQWKKAYAAIKAEVQALPGAADLVRELAERGFLVALASSGEPEFAQDAMDQLDIAQEVAVLTSSEDVDASKPEPDLVEETLSRLPDVRGAVFVGDTPYDVESAGRAGLSCVAVLTGGYSEAELTGAGAVLVVESPADLLGLDWTGYLSAAGAQSR
jgi:HAD superfamily hydrolase (TIGR01549 family)